MAFQCALIRIGKRKRRAKRASCFVENGRKQYGCCGYQDRYTGKPLQECQKCERFERT